MYRFEKYLEIVRQPWEPVRWIIEGKIAEQDRTLFFAEWGRLKTRATLGLCIDLARGRPWLGRFGVPRAFRVRYINEEDKRVSIRRHMKRLAMGKDMEHANLP